MQAGDIEIGKTDNEGRYLFKLAGTDRGRRACSDSRGALAHGYPDVKRHQRWPVEPRKQPTYLGGRALASTRPPGVQLPRRPAPVLSGSARGAGLFGRSLRALWRHRTSLIPALVSQEKQLSLTARARGRRRRNRC